MVGFPIDELMDEDVCHLYLLNRLHPDGLKCPHCGGEGRYTAKRNTWFDGYSCTSCKRYYTMYTGTVLDRTRQSASKLVLVLVASPRAKAPPGWAGSSTSTGRTC